MCQGANITSSTINAVSVQALQSLVLSGCTQLKERKKKKESGGSFLRREEKETSLRLMSTLSLAIHSQTGNRRSSSKTYKTYAILLLLPSSSSTTEPFALLSKTHAHSNG